MIIATSIHPASQVDWTGEFPGCEASDFGRTQPLMSQLYDDACDVGFGLRSPTGNVTYWYVDGLDEDDEGEVQGWRMKPCSESIRKFPRIKGIELLVVND